MVDQILNLRQSLGGAGYTAWSALPYLFDTGNPLVTLEGDNTVMAQQSFNHLLKLAKKAYNREAKFTGVFTYLNEMNTFQNIKCGKIAPKEFLTLDKIFEALKVKVLSQLRFLVQQKLDRDLKKKDFVNHLYALEIVKASNEHIKLITYYEFMNQIKTRVFKCPNIRPQLANLCMLYGLNLLNESPKDLYNSGYFNVPGVHYSNVLLDAIKLLLKEIRPQVLNLIEVVPLQDDHIFSAIGNSYGDIYETHLDWAKNSKLNKTSHGDAIPEGFYKHMSPIRERNAKM